MALSTLPTPASLKERDDSPSLQFLAIVKKSLEDSQQLQLRELHLHDLQSWFVFYNIVSQHLVNNLNTAKNDNKKLTKQVTQLQAKVQSLQSSITQSTTIDKIHSYEKHCLDLITPATTHSIMKELGFLTVKEIPNSGNIASLLPSLVFAQGLFHPEVCQQHVQQVILDKVPCCSHCSAGTSQAQQFCQVHSWYPGNAVFPSSRV